MLSFFFLGKKMGTLERFMLATLQLSSSGCQKVSSPTLFEGIGYGLSI